MATIEERLSAIEKTLAAIKIAFVGGASVAASANNQAGEIASDDIMSREWADMEIRKDPPKTLEPSSVGLKMSQCSVQYLLDYASFNEWAAEKGRNETPVRLNAKGKPWHESNSLTAKVARGWAKRKSAPAPTDEEIPF